MFMMKIHVLRVHWCESIPLQTGSLFGLVVFSPPLEDLLTFTRFRLNP